ncbi:unnamed protein product [marine sediment metagenome]|uniref:Uncharacterized protein n=1 Tax=marine sediment metagenome TaxID=412755 RepID=X1HFA3_9ZZZZ
MKKLFVALVLALSLSLWINIIALGDPGSSSSQVQSVPPDSPVVCVME